MSFFTLEIVFCFQIVLNFLS